MTMMKGWPRDVNEWSHGEDEGDGEAKGHYGLLVHVCLGSSVDDLSVW